MPPFSSRAAAEAHEPWTVETLDGRIHSGRPISRPALLRFWAAIETAKDDAFAQEEALRRLLRVAFPARWRYVIQPGRDPVPQILAMGIKDRERALESFFAALTPDAPASGPTMPTPGPPASANSSAAPTP
jgi:hypothetical protein